jgi:hypothetical protein
MVGTEIASFNKFGFNADVDASEESIWDAGDLPSAGDGPDRCFVNIPASVPGIILVSSDDVADAGLGISIETIDEDWNMLTVEMTLAGANIFSGTLTKVLSLTKLIRVNRAYATGDAFTGNIYIHIDLFDTGGDGVPDEPATQTIAVITAGENQTLQACYTVPRGYTALLTQFCVSNIANANVKSVDFRVRRSVMGMASRTTEINSLVNGEYACTLHDPPIRFSEKTDIELTALASGAGAAISGTFDLLLVPNTM